MSTPALSRFNGSRCRARIRFFPIFSPSFTFETVEGIHSRPPGSLSLSLSRDPARNRRARNVTRDTTRAPIYSNRRARARTRELWIARFIRNNYFAVASQRRVFILCFFSRRFHVISNRSRFFFALPCNQGLRSRHCKRNERDCGLNSEKEPHG